MPLLLSPVCWTWLCLCLLVEALFFRSFFLFVFLFSFFFFYNICKWSFFFFFSDPLTRQVSFFPFFPSSRSVPIFLIAQNWFIQLVKKALPESLLSEEIVRVLTLPLFFLLFLFFFFAFWKVEANVSLPPCNQWCSNDPRKTVVSWRYSSAFLQYLFFLSFYFRFLFLQKEKQRSYVILSSALENYGLGRFFVCFWSFFVCVVAVLYFALPCGNACSCENMKLRFFSTHTDTHTYTQTAISSFFVVVVLYSVNVLSVQLNMATRLNNYRQEFCFSPFFCV